MDFARELIERIRGNAERLLVMAGELPRVRLKGNAGRLRP
jgi:hypothetical protein